MLDDLNIADDEESVAVARRSKSVAGVGIVTLDDEDMDL